MRKSYSYFAFLLTIAGANTSFASNENIYLGVGGGANPISIQKNVEVTALPADFSPWALETTQTYNSRSGSVRGMAQIFAGFSFNTERWENFVASVEAIGNFNFGSQSSSIIHWEYSGNNPNAPASIGVNEKIKYGFGISALPGFKINDNNSVFIKLGWTRTKLESNATGYLNSGGVLGASGRFNKWLDGFSIGAGAQMQLCQSLWLRGEYVYTKFNKYTRSTNEPILQSQPTIDSAVTTASYRPTTNLVALSAVYYFSLNKMTEFFDKSGYYN